MGKPLFSIIVPVYNTQQFIGECIHSVLSQEMEDYELILVDDGSDDQSGIICDAFSKQDERIKVFHKDNGGQLQTRLFGLSHAKGKYCLYLDSDDYLEQGALKYLKSMFSELNCDCIIFGFRRVLNNRVLHTYTAKEDILFTDKHDILKECFSDNINNSICRKSFKIDLYKPGELSKYYHLRRGEDLIQSLDMLKYCNTVFFSKEILYNYRMNEKSVTHQNTPFVEEICFPISEYALQYIIKEAHFSEKELDAYRGTRFSESFLPLLYRIALSDEPLQKKKKAFRTIRETEYYKKFLSRRLFYSAEKKRDLCILMFFKYGFDSLIILLVRLAFMIKTKRG